MSLRKVGNMDWGRRDGTAVSDPLVLGQGNRKEPVSPLVGIFVTPRDVDWGRRCWMMTDSDLYLVVSAVAVLLFVFAIPFFGPCSSDGDICHIIVISAGDNLCRSEGGRGPIQKRGPEGGFGTKGSNGEPISSLARSLYYRSYDTCHTFLSTTTLIEKGGQIPERQ